MFSNRLLCVPMFSLYSLKKKNKQIKYVYTNYFRYLLKLINVVHKMLYFSMYYNIILITIIIQYRLKPLRNNLSIMQINMKFIFSMILACIKFI